MTSSSLKSDLVEATVDIQQASFAADVATAFASAEALSETDSVAGIEAIADVIVLASEVHGPLSEQTFCARLFCADRVNTQGMLHLKANELKLADRYFRRGLSVLDNHWGHRDNADRLEILTVLLKNSATVARRQKRMDVAERFLQRAARLESRIGSASRAGTLLQLCVLRAVKHQHRAALEFARKAVHALPMAGTILGLVDETGGTLPEAELPIAHMVAMAHNNCLTQCEYLSMGSDAYFHAKIVRSLLRIFPRGDKLRSELWPQVRPVIRRFERRSSVTRTPRSLRTRPQFDSSPIRSPPGSLSRCASIGSAGSPSHHCRPVTAPARCCTQSTTRLSPYSVSTSPKIKKLRRQTVNKLRARRKRDSRARKKRHHPPMAIVLRLSEEPVETSSLLSPRHIAPE